MRKIKIYKSELEEAYEKVEAWAKAQVKTQVEAQVAAQVEAQVAAQVEAQVAAQVEAKDRELEAQKEENSKLTQKIEKLQNILKKNNIAVL